MDMSVIFISEFISRQALETLNQSHQVRYEPESYSDPSKLASGLINADAWIVRNLTKVSADLVQGAKQLKVVGRLGVGLENIDLPACANANIKVIPATGANADSVAEYVLVHRWHSCVLMHPLVLRPSQAFGQDPNTPNAMRSQVTP